jgi:hypothetical protein
VAARSKLENLLASCVIDDGDNVSVDGIPTLEKGVIEAWIDTGAEVPSVVIEGIVVLVNHNTLIKSEISYSLVGATIELLEVIAVLSIDELNLR